MAAKGKQPAESSGSDSSSESLRISDFVPEGFPEGMRVLVVDHDRTCLAVLKCMLKECHYVVTACTEARVALSILRERKNDFDVVLTDVHMPGMDGFTLLEHIGLEMDLPVIMVSADDNPSTVIKGVKHGACDYMVKPVRIEELQIMWQHVLRRKHQLFERSRKLKNSDHERQVSDDAEYTSLVNDGKDGKLKSEKKKRGVKKNKDDDDNVDSSLPKKQRVVWMSQRHQRFVDAVNKLGIDKAVPKKILELMSPSDLTRENIASHLQKYRMYLKKASAALRRKNGPPNPFSGSVEPNANAGSYGRFRFQNFPASGQIPPGTWPTLSSELLDQPSGRHTLPVTNHQTFRRLPLHGHKSNPWEQVAYHQPELQFQTNASKQFYHPNGPVQNMYSGFPTWTSSMSSIVGSSDNLGKIEHAANLQHQHAVNVQPSFPISHSQPLNSLHSGGNTLPMNQPSRVASSQSFLTFQARKKSVSVNQNINNDCTDLDHELLPSLLNNFPYGTTQILDGGLNNVGVVSSCPIPGQASAVPFSSVNTDAGADWRMQPLYMDSNIAIRIPGHAPNLGNFQGPGTTMGTSLDQGQMENFGLLGVGTLIPGSFAVNDAESSNIKPNNSNMEERVPEEFSLSDFLNDFPNRDG